MVTATSRLTSYLRGQFQGAHSFLEGSMADVTPEQAHWLPPGKALPIGAQYAHVALSEDGLVNGLLKGSAPLAATAWAGKVGVSELPPEAGPWDEWARRLQVDLPSLRQYAQAVNANTYEYLDSLADEDLSRPLDLSSWGVGQQTVGFVVNILLGNVSNHCGEISCLKGLQGAKGYPA